MLISLLLTLPWLGILALLVFRTRLPRPLPEAPVGSDDLPRVSVIVPARNEERSIVECVGSLARSEYPDFEIVVVDDRSVDATAGLAAAVDAGNARTVEVLEGAELPPGWMGKPWACAQGAARATGDVLLFTDADTVHHPTLMAEAVRALDEDEADLLTLLGRQILETFWERVAQTHIFLAMFMRYPDFERTARDGHWRDAIANGQYMLFRRESYDAIGGHEAVRDSVVEDQALAQLVRRAGRVLSVRRSEDHFATRMYRSLGEIVDGWTKNILHGGRASLPPLLRGLMAPAAVVSGLGLWIVPPLCLAAALSGVGGPGLLVWSAVSVVWSCALWIRFTALMRLPPLYGLAYPAGAAVGVYILVRAWVRGAHVTWKGRDYTVRPGGEGA